MHAPTHAQERAPARVPDPILSPEDPSMLDLSTPMLISGLILGGAGMFLFFRGRSNQEPTSVLAGIALSVLPMVLHSVLVLWGLSAAVIAGWVALRRLAETGPVA